MEHKPLVSAIAVHELAAGYFFSVLQFSSEKKMETTRFHLFPVLSSVSRMKC